MKKVQKSIIALIAGTSVFSLTAFNAFAATVDLPEVFSDLSPIIEAVLKIVEFISKFFSLLS